MLYNIKRVAIPYPSLSLSCSDSVTGTLVLISMSKPKPIFLTLVGQNTYCNTFSQWNLFLFFPFLYILINISSLNPFSRIYLLWLILIIAIQHCILKVPKYINCKLVYVGFCCDLNHVTFGWTGHAEKK